MRGQARGLLSGDGASRVTAKAHGSGAGVEARWDWVGGTNEGWGLLQGRPGLQEAGLLLKRWGLAMEGRRGWQGGSQEGRGLVEGGGVGRHRNLT